MDDVYITAGYPYPGIDDIYATTGSGSLCPRICGISGG
jgi:hypothetical protein